MVALKNRAGVSTSTSGTGILTLGPALPAGAVPYAASWLNFTDAGVQNGEIVRYLILDGLGRWEYGPGQYNVFGPTLTRPATVMDGTIPGQRSSTGALLPLSGSSQVFITAVAEDLLNVNTLPPFISGTLTNHAVVVGQGGTAAGTVPLGTDGQVLVGQNANDPAFKSVGGDGTLSATGSLTVTKTNGVVFAASATIDTTNATNITSGNLSVNQLNGGSGASSATFWRGDGTWSAPGAASFAPIGAEYITSTVDATLTSERVLTDTATITWDRATAGQIKANVAVSYQPLDADLTSWALITRATGFDTFATTPTSANLASLVTDETGTAGSLVFSVSPALTGNPTATTQTAGDNSTRIATTAFVVASFQPLDADLTSWAGVTRAAGFDTFAATPTSANLAALLTDETGTGANVFANSPTLTGDPKAPTPAAGDNDTSIATTAFVQSTLTAYADPQRAITGAAGAVTGLSTDVVVTFNWTSGTSGTYSLPLANTRAGLPIMIKDVGGTFGSRPLTINRSGSDTIDGQTSITLNVAFQYIKLRPLAAGTGWFIER